MGKSISKKKLCSQPAPIARTFDAGISSHRLKFIMTVTKKWANGTEIKYMFLDGPAAQQNVVRQAFQQWKDLGIGLIFTEVDSADESLVRIGFNQNDGSWSYVGRDLLNIPKAEKTMNFGWDLTADSYGMTTALHEIGHSIGFEHEHQSPFAGIVWDTQAVYDEFSGPPNNWPKQTIDSNILNKLSANQVSGSEWDAKSIMEYEFGPGLVLGPAEFKKGIFPPGILSAGDISGVKSFYPPLDAATTIKLQPLQSALIKSVSGGQDDFIFTAPVTRKYTFQVFGELDTVMVISEKSEAGNQYLSGDDDSGFNKNAKITLPLVKGRDYLVNVRVMFSQQENAGGIVVS